MLLHLETHKYYSLNRTGGLVWELIGKGETPQETREVGGTEEKAADKEGKKESALKQFTIDLNEKADALASTANFLRGHGWRPGLGYRPGEPNYAALQGWNAASVYQQALAIMGNEIDGN